MSYGRVAVALRCDGVPAAALWISLIVTVGSAHHGAAFLALPFGLFVYFRFKKMALGGGGEGAKVAADSAPE